MQLYKRRFCNCVFHTSQYAIVTLFHSPSRSEGDIVALFFLLFLLPLVIHIHMLSRSTLLFHGLKWFAHLFSSHASGKRKKRRKREKMVRGGPLDAHDVDREITPFNCYLM
eukprot:c16190_g1_i1 orf=2-331(-)